MGVSGGAPADVAPAVLLVEAPAGPPGGAGPAYERPEPSEVAEFVAASGGHPIDAERFCRWHDDHGWPPRGWHGTALNWAAGDAARAASERAGREAIRDELSYLDEGAERV